MQDATVLKLIALRSDDSVLGVMSRTPGLWSALQPELENQHFWYERTEAAFNLPPEFQWEYGNNSHENWQHVYNILMSTKLGDPFAITPARRPGTIQVNKYNFTAVKFLLQAGYKTPGLVSVNDAIAHGGSLDVIKLLLVQPRAYSDTLNALVDIRYVVRTGRLEFVKAIIDDTKARDGLEGPVVLRALIGGVEEAVIQNQMLILEYLLSLRGYRKQDLDELIETAIERESIGPLELLLDEVKPNRDTLLDYIDNAQFFKSPKSLEILTVRLEALDM